MTDNTITNVKIKMENIQIKTELKILMNSVQAYTRYCVL